MLYLFLIPCLKLLLNCRWGLLDCQEQLGHRMGWKWFLPDPSWKWWMCLWEHGTSIYTYHLSLNSKLTFDILFLSLSFFFLNSKDDKLLAVFQSLTFIFHVWIFIWLSNTCAWITTEERDIIHTNLEKVFPHLWLKINTKERKWIALKSALTV